MDKANTRRDELMVEWRQKVAPVLHVRRLLISRLGNHRIENDDDYDTVIQKLIGAIGPRYIDRPGGYTRILKLTKRRLGDAGPQAMISLVTADGSSPRKRRPAEPGAKKSSPGAKE
jgi:large subunit ribosomal protein L17